MISRIGRFDPHSVCFAIAFLYPEFAAVSDAASRIAQPRIFA